MTGKQRLPFIGADVRPARRKRRGGGFWSGHPRALIVLYCCVFVLITALAVIIGGHAIRELVDPASDGHLGTAVVDRCPQGRHVSGCYGHFTSNDHQVSLRDVQVVGEDYASPGQSFAAYGEQGGRQVTVVASAEQRWSDILGPLLFLAIVVGAFVFLVYRPIRAHRSTRSAGSARSAPSARRAG